MGGCATPPPVVMTSTDGQANIDVSVTVRRDECSMTAAVLTCQIGRSGYCTAGMPVVDPNWHIVEQTSDMQRLAPASAWLPTDACRPQRWHV